jgi:hypothetical protein
MTWLADLTNPAPQYRDRRAFQRAAHEMARQGLKPRDIADALRITTGAVLELLQEPPPLEPRNRRPR